MDRKGSALWRMLGLDRREEDEPDSTYRNSHAVEGKTTDLYDWPEKGE